MSKGAGILFLGVTELNFYFSWLGGRFEIAIAIGV